MVVRALLRCLGVAFEDAEIDAGLEEPVDVEFRAARFQIRDLIGDRKRSKQLAEREQRYQEAKTISDVDDTVYCFDCDPVRSRRRDGRRGLDGEVAPVRAATLRNARRHRLCRSRRFASLSGRAAGGASDALAELRRQGWRSVSMLSLPYGVVLTANAERA